MLEEKIWILDQARLSPELVKAFENDLVTIRDGVVYWAKGSGKNGIVAHLPFKEAAYESMEKALQAAQATTVITAVVSTGIILGAIAIQTKYLSDKLDAIRNTVDLIAKEVHSQQIIFYMDNVSAYAGHIEAARVLLQDRSIASEIHGVAEPLIASMLVQRNKILSFVDNVLVLAQSTDSTTPEHAKLIINFTNMIMGMLPFGIHLEHLLCARIGKIALADCVLQDGAKRFATAVDSYRRVLNSWHHGLVAGKLKGRMSTYKAVEKQAQTLFTTLETIQPYLLTLPMGKQVEPFMTKAVKIKRYKASQ